MAQPLLETKLHIPTWRTGLVTRPRLLERLDRGAEAKLTLVSAPAGFGKTTLVAAWLASGQRRAAWLSLDARDNHAASFWMYVIAALQRVAPGIGAETANLLDSAEASIELSLGLLLNDLSALPDEVVLVLDDYHVIDTHAIHEGLVFLLEHLPAQVHVVIASRADPPFPRARLRARGELVELRAADLRFTPDEAAVYLNEAMELKLSAPDLAALEERTEGWIAALQLAALSMHGRADVSGFIADFAGDDRYIVDYLVEEVLHRQPEAVRTFLLQTCVLDRLSGSLCDAVTGGHSANTTLEALERANLFVIPLDDRRQWYRYHHLFADVLRTRLAEERPADVQQLHRRASDWYEQVGQRPEAIHHALAARDFSRAADLVELAWPALRNQQAEKLLRGWLAALPDEVLRDRPVLSNAYAGVLLTSGEVDGVDAHLRNAERWLDPASPRVADMVVIDDAEFQHLPASVALHRAGYALIRGDLAETARHARRARELALEDDHLSRGGATALLGLAAWTSGDLEIAYETYAQGMADVQRSGHISGISGSANNLADIRIAQGRLREAMRIYEQALQRATEQGRTVLRGASDIYVGMGDLYREWNDLDAATHVLLRSRELGEHAGFPQHRYRWLVAMARIHEATGDLDGSLDLLTQAEPLYMNDLSPNVRPVAAMKARIFVRQGRLGDALAWAREQGLSADDGLSYVREFEHITLARVLLASDAVPEAVSLLERLLESATTGVRNGSVIDILVVLTLAHQSRGDSAAAHAALEHALRLAEPEGYVRIFADEGGPLAAVLHTAAKRRVFPDYVQRLLTARGARGELPTAGPGLVEPLSERELDVLRLLATDLGGPDIAGQLVVSLNTLRTHTRSIFNKLGVNNRRAAVRRGQELELLPTTRV